MAVRPDDRQLSGSARQDLLGPPGGPARATSPSSPEAGQARSGRPDWACAKHLTRTAQTQSISAISKASAERTNSSQALAAQRISAVIDSTGQWERPPAPRAHPGRGSCVPAGPGRSIGMLNHHSRWASAHPRATSTTRGGHEHIGGAASEGGDRRLLVGGCPLRPCSRPKHAGRRAPRR